MHQPFPKQRVNNHVEGPFQDYQARWQFNDLELLRRIALHCNVTTRDC